MVTVPTFDKLWFLVPVPYLDHKNTVFRKNFGKSMPFYILSFFARKKLIRFIKFMVKCELKKSLMKEIEYRTQLYTVCLWELLWCHFKYGSDFLTSYGSGSTRQKVTVPTVPVPVPQHWRLPQAWTMKNPFPSTWNEEAAGKLNQVSSILI